MTRTAEEWGRIALSLPGWRWMPGIITTTGNRVLDVSFTTPPYLVVSCNGGPVSRPTSTSAIPDPDDPATEGCLIRLLGPVHEAVWYTGDCDRWVVAVGEERRLYTSLGRACIAAAQALGRWPAGE